ncbi:hypothetical protein CANCADRAFT_58172 [Tortispora caseinolytica NRRL Y-17796]|uniref:Protein ARV n=1 Tax=Tortispora caseinolytica NRRL Y-17796 TaxID=767744 RepID=A0A1E4TBR2_9ASCO|nr:hypothetical protein CANCADRAFT_58172 [Tortispora caseinolytica NRRL Y-17796]
MICIECAHPVSSLFTQYSSTNIRLTPCPNCKKFADKYIEFDGVIILIDLLLLKPQVYRHLVFNRFGTDNSSLHSVAKRMLFLFTMFDVYLAWVRVEKQPPNPISTYILSFPVFGQYFFFITYCFLNVIATHFTIRLLARYFLHWPKPAALSTTILISYAPKLFPVLMIIWYYDVPSAIASVDWIVNLCLIEALHIILECSYLTTMLMTSAAALVRIIAAKFILLPIVLRNTDLHASLFEPDIAGLFTLPIN